MKTNKIKSFSEHCAAAAGVFFSGLLILLSAPSAQAQTCAAPTVIPTCSAGQALTSNGTTLSCVSTGAGKFDGIFVASLNIGAPVPQSTLNNTYPNIYLYCVVKNTVTGACSCPAGDTAYSAGISVINDPSNINGSSYLYNYICSQ